MAFYTFYRKLLILEGKLTSTSNFYDVKKSHFDLKLTCCQWDKYFFKLTSRASFLYRICLILKTTTVRPLILTVNGKYVGESQYYLLGDRRYRPICNHTVKFSAENSVFKNFAKSSLPVSDRTKSERPFAHRSGSVSNVVFSLLFSLIKILKIEINSHPGGVRYNLRWLMVSVKTL